MRLSSFLVSLFAMTIAAASDSSGQRSAVYDSVRHAFTTIAGKQLYTIAVMFLEANCEDHGFANAEQIKGLVVAYLHGRNIKPFTVQEQQKDVWPPQHELEFTGPDCTITATVDEQSPLKVVFRARRSDGTGFSLEYDVQDGVKTVSEFGQD